MTHPLCAAMRRYVPSLALAGALLLVMAAGGTPAFAASAGGPGPGGPSKACNVHIKGDKLTAPRGGGAATQTYTVNKDCSITKGSVRTLRRGSAEFQAFLAGKQPHSASPVVDPSCDSELDYQDVANANLTFTQLQQGYSYDPGAGQVVSLGSYWKNGGVAVDGWYFITDSQGPWGGPIPYGTVTVSYYAEFAWVGGSFWHSHKNNGSSLN